MTKPRLRQLPLFGEPLRKPLMRFSVHFSSVVVVIADDLDEAVEIVLNQKFNLTTASMPIVHDVEVLDDEDDEDEDGA